MRRLAIAYGLLVVLTACGGASDQSGADAPSRAGGGRGDTAGRGDAAAQRPAEKQNALTGAVALGREQIRTGELTVRVDDVAAAARTAIRTAETAGGFLESEQTDAERTTLTLRVPPEEFTKTADALGRLGTVADRVVETEDVTTDVADVEGRLKAARASVERVRALLGRATTISEITSLEEELNDREAALESLETRQRALAAKTSFASLTVTFTPPVLAAPRVDDASFGSGLAAGWRVFRTAVVILLVLLGAVLPFAAAGLAVGLPVYLLRRRATARA